VLQVDPYYAAVVGVVKTPTVMAGVGYAVLVVAVVHLLRRVRRRYCAGDGGRVAAFAIGCFLILYFPASQIISVGAIMAERLIFAASVPFAMLAALGAARVFRWAQAQFRRSPVCLGALFAIVLVLCSLRSLARAREWHDAQSLWLSMLAHVQHPHAYTNLGIDALSRDDVPAAKAYFSKAIELDHDPYLAWFNLAAHAERQYRITEALALYRGALAARPGDEATRVRIANCEDAIAAARQLVEQYRSQLEQTRDVQILRKLGGACVVVGDLPCAERAVKRIVNPDAR
jgi:tetratricopeptide (TPR) repeat protein